MDRIKRKKWHRILSRIIPVIHVECCNSRFLLFYPNANVKPVSLKDATRDTGSKG